MTDLQTDIDRVNQERFNESLMTFSPDLFLLRESMKDNHTDIRVVQQFMHCLGQLSGNRGGSGYGKVITLVKDSRVTNMVTESSYIVERPLESEELR